MLVFRSIPIDIIQINEKTAVDLYIKHKDKLVTYLPKDSFYTADHLYEIHDAGITKFYVKGKDKKLLDK
jgi:hypothetical protein